jgi:hypothetical protein
MELDHENLEAASYRILEHLVERGAVVALLHVLGSPFIGVRWRVHKLQAVDLDQCGGEMRCQSVLDRQGRVRPVFHPYARTPTVDGPHDAVTRERRDPVVLQL